MTSSLVLTQKHCKFLFDKSNDFNVFNLTRLCKQLQSSEGINLDISRLEEVKQQLIISKLEYFSNHCNKILNIKDNDVTFKVKLAEQEVERLTSRLTLDIIYSGDEIIFQPTNIDVKNKNDPHQIKNIRGAVLLSLVQELLNLQKLDNQITLFDATSPIILHSASDFLHSTDNALVMWQVLVQWTEEHNKSYRAGVNPRINSSLKAKKSLKLNISNVLKNTDIANIGFHHLLANEAIKADFLRNDFIWNSKLNIWFVDDQEANGWKNLILNLLEGLEIELNCCHSVEDLKMTIDLANAKAINKPDVALVDLRLSENDLTFESYKGADLSGFTALHQLLTHWPSLPVIIASASNKIWNLEKAIEKGATGYWRKSEDIHEAVNHNAIITAFDIYDQLIDKLNQAISKIKFRNIFVLVKLIEAESVKKKFKSSPLERAFSYYMNDLFNKVSWMIWQRQNEKKESRVMDSLFLGIMELYNEIEPYLWDSDLKTLTLYPSKKVKTLKAKTDKRVINDTFQCFDEDYKVGGIDLCSSYDRCKNIRNHLPVIHGSSDGKITHSKIDDIELGLFLIWFLMSKLNES